MNRYPLCVFFLVTDFSAPHNIFFFTRNFLFSMKSSKTRPEKMFYPKTFLLLRCFCLEEFFVFPSASFCSAAGAWDSGDDVYFYFGRIACVPDALVSFLSLPPFRLIKRSTGKRRIFLT
jgi:hypothetical protein